MIFNIRDFGAVGDGVQLDSPAIQRAIDAMAASGEPGTVVVPSGKYRCGSIQCASDLTLQLEAGALLKASSDIADFTERSEFAYLPFFFIGGFNCHNLTITGPGTIDGNGFAFWEDGIYYNGAPGNEALLDQAHENNISYPLQPKERRPVLMMFVGCENIILRDFQIRDSAVYTIWPLACTHVRIENLDVKTYRQGPNSDVLDIDSSCDVIVSNCRIDAGDDCIALKTSHDRLSVPRPCERICVTNCILTSPTCGIRIGFEGDAPIRDCVFSNLIIYDSGHGLDIISVTARRKGMVISHGCDIEQILFSNIVMRNVASAIYLWAGRFGAPASDQPDYKAHVSDITFSGITASTMNVSFIGCVENNPHFVRNLTLRDVTLNCQRNSRSGNPTRFTKPYWTLSSPDALDILNVDSLFISNLRISGGDIRGARIENLTSDIPVLPIPEEDLAFLSQE